jgi:hypothetical protein
MLYGAGIIFLAFDEPYLILCSQTPQGYSFSLLPLMFAASAFGYVLVESGVSIW